MLVSSKLLEKSFDFEMKKVYYINYVKKCAVPITHLWLYVCVEEFHEYISRPGRHIQVFRVVFYPGFVRHNNIFDWNSSFH